MVEPLLLIAGLTAISLAISALFDLLTGPSSRPRRVAWALLVVSLPVVGPVLYYLHAPRAPRRPSAVRRRPGVSRARPERRDDQPDAEVPDEPEASEGPATVETVDREHA